MQVITLTYLNAVNSSRENRGKPKLTLEQALAATSEIVVPVESQVVAEYLVTGNFNADGDPVILETTEVVQERPTFEGFLPVEAADVAPPEPRVADIDPELVVDEDLDNDGIIDSHEPPLTEPPVAPEATDLKAAAPTREALDEMSKAEMVQYAEANNISVTKSGTRGEIIEQILDATKPRE